MGKSSSGPDLTDVETLMRAIEALHGGQVQLTVSPAGIGSGGGLSVVLTHSVPALDADGGVSQLAIVNRWPCPIHREWWDCIFEGLYRLDAKVGRGYAQLTLPQA